ncbi:hypothetical protein D9619_001337 [Psilocybe cf. subviscida]|uniref:Adhesin domain-containing protein n=1 Tax=Psilocybe cf. subviscida TaxID=2480587 RepID=A0A8H5BD82_9AGAR|nr:hypothetical protein D9619_001337 [Psilocybe cf. subviscida]
MASSRQTGIFDKVMGVFQSRGKYNDYNQAALDEEEGRVALTSASVADIHETGRDEAGIALLETEPQVASKRKRLTCCTVFGYELSVRMFWRVVGFVLGGYTLYLGFRAFQWALTDAPTGLENKPVFGEVICSATAPHIYNRTEVTIMTPISTRGQDHLFDIRGAAVGTITIADGKADATEVVYTMTLRSNAAGVVEDTKFIYPDIDADTGVVTRSRLIIDTSHVPATNHYKCMRFDITMYVPPTLKRLHVASHANATHVRFAPGTRAAMENLIVTLYTSTNRNLIETNFNVTPEELSLEVYEGYIVGEASIVKDTSVFTQRGDGVANVKFRPASSYKSNLHTATGAGRSDFKFIKNEKFSNQIEASHISSRNGDIYLTYAESGFNGKIDMGSTSFTVTNAQRFDNTVPGDDTEPKFTHYHGSISGEDRIFVTSRGWTGLYF